MYSSALAKDAQYPHWHLHPQHKAATPDIARPYAIPKETNVASKDAALNKELGLDDVYDPMVSRTTPSTLGPQTPPAYTEDATLISPITLPTLGESRDSGFVGLASGVASLVNKHDDCLLNNGLPPGLPMDAGISRALGSGQSSNRDTPMSLGSPIMPGAGRADVLKRLVEATTNLTAFTDTMKCMQEKAKRKQLERSCRILPTIKKTPTGCRRHPHYEHRHCR